MEPSRVPQEVVAEWQDTLVNWTYRSSHDALLGRAVKHQQLAWVATRYREAARSNPYDPIARDRLKAVQRAAALITLATPPREPERKSHSALTLMLVGIMLSTGLGLGAARYMRDHRAAVIVSHQP